MKIISWNIAGIRAKIKKGYLDFLEKGENDIICFQETKAEKEQVEIPEGISNIYKYRYWNSCTGENQRKGLNGTSIWCKKEPLRIIEPMELSKSEGRITALEFNSFILVTVYTPNSQGLGTERNKYRVNQWDIEFIKWINELNNLKTTIVCGDLNVAHKDIDVYKPKEWRNSAGMLEEERNNFKSLLNSGNKWIDTFRYTHKNEPYNYTYWNQRIPSYRNQNIGWRIDYFIIPKGKRRWIKKSEILADIYGSDHCPILLVIKPIKIIL